jgi:hypothetical protein
VVNAPVGDLIREEGGDNVEDARDNAVVLNDMQGGRWNGK